MTKLIFRYINGKLRPMWVKQEHINNKTKTNFIKNKLTTNHKNANIQEAFVFEDVGVSREIDVDNDDLIQEHYDKATTELLNQIEDDIKNLNYEKGVLIGKDGSVYYEINGDEHSIDVNDYPKSDFKNAIFTHNHPLGYGFSLDADILTFLEDDLYEIRAITPNGKLFSLRKGNDVVDKVGFTKAFQNNYPTYAYISNIVVRNIKNNKSLQDEIFKKLKTNQLAINDYALQVRDELVYDFMKKNANKYGFVYEVKNDR